MSNLQGAVLLGGAAEAKTISEFKRAIAMPWEILRYRVTFRDHGVDEACPEGVLLVRIADTLLNHGTIVTVQMSDILTVSRDQKSLRAFLQQISDAARVEFAAAAIADKKIVRTWERYKAWRKRRKANARKD